MSEFRTVVADPPWTPELGGSWGAQVDKGRPQRFYDTMTLDDIKALRVPSASQAHLYLWAITPHVDWGWHGGLISFVGSGQSRWRGAAPLYAVEEVYRDRDLDHAAAAMRGSRSGWCIGPRSRPRMLSSLGGERKTRQSRESRTIPLAVGQQGEGLIPRPRRRGQASLWGRNV